MSRSTNRRWLLAGIALLLGVAALGSGAPGTSGESGQAPVAPAPNEDTAGPPGYGAPGAAGIRAHLDPETGRLIERRRDPLAELSRDRSGDWLNTYGGDLIEEPLPGGGFKIDLRGRFRSAVVATIDPETDEVEIDCVPESAGGEAPDGR